MPTVIEKPGPQSPKAGLATRAAKDEWRRGMRWLVISVVVAAATFALWWLVATTNREGHHDAELLPLFTLIPLVPAIYHLVHARLRP